MTYDNMGRILSIDAGTSRAKFEYSYVANEDNIYRMQFDHRSGSPYNEFTYDNLDRVTDVTYLSNSQDTEEFPMDDLGNRTGSVAQRDGAHTYAVNSLTNRYTAIDSNSITHDAAGNLTQDKDGYHYVYDYENRVTRIYKLDGQTEITVAVFAYDALGRRIKKTDSIASETTYYYYNDQWQILAEYAGSAFGNSYVYGNYIDEVLVMNDGTNDYYYAHDHLYSPVALMETDGDVVERYEYDVYGKRAVMTDNFQSRTWSMYGNDFGLTGREVDDLDFNSADTPRLQHMHYRHRDYSPFMGRFMQHDPLGIVPNTIYNAYQPTMQYNDGVNVYQYVISKPVMKIDPMGLDTPGCTTPLGDMGNHCWRRCCAAHDQCYARGGNPPGGSRCESDSWCGRDRPECIRCNDQVTLCMIGGAICGWDDTDQDYYCGVCGRYYGKADLPIHENHDTDQGPNQPPLPPIP